MAQVCEECGGRLRPRGRKMICKRCGAELVKLDQETVDHLRAWMEVHPLRHLPNWPNVPLFPTQDASKIEAILEWSRSHPGESVPDELMMSVRSDAREAEVSALRSFIKAGMLESHPAAVWTFHQTGLFPTEENFELMPPEDQEECELAWSQWDKMSDPERAVFVTRMRAFAEALGTK